MLESIEKILKEQSKDRDILTLNEFPKPSLLPGIVKGAKRIIENLNNGKRMLIVGDYDCDGINATTIMIDFFRKIGYSEQVDYIVPDRFVDGYGVSLNIINYAIKNYYDFIVTVDNGIGAGEAVVYATENKIEVIITDHHTPGENVPMVDIIINPKYDLGNFPFMEISGATVSWYLCYQVKIELDLDIDMTQWLDLVGITVISDVMPLKSLNVTLVNFALNQIKNKSRYVFGLAFDPNKRANLTETDIAFGYVPMINAIGRIDHAKNAIELLLSNNVKDIKSKFSYMVNINNKRKFLNEELLNRVLPEAQEQFDNGAKAIVVKQNDLHEGIVGILAGKLAEKFMVPSFVFTWNNAKKCFKGSGRTSGKIQLYDLVNLAASEVIGFGGHAGAVGIAIKKSNIESWTKIINSEASKIDKNDFYPIGQTPFVCDFSSINNNLMELINEFRPYGQGFPAPVFKSKVYLTVVDSYKECLHWKCLLIDQNGETKNAWFFHDKNIGNYNGMTVNVTYFPVQVTGNNGTEIELHAKINYADL